MNQPNRQSVFALGMLIVGIGLSSAPAATPLTTERVATGLDRPVFVTAPPGDLGRLFIVEQKTGQIKILNLQTGTLNATPFLTVTGIATSGNEQGLLGLAFHPDYASNGFFYVNYTDTAGDTVVARYQRLTDDVADAGSRDILLTFDQPQANHNGGWLGFGPQDGYLHVSTGDGGSACDPGERAQNTDLLLGKILRIDVNGDDFPGDPNRDYAIPPTNPFVGTNGADEIWAYGLRNPWRCSHDRVTAHLYIGDVGQASREEIDFLPATGAADINYGWDCMEGVDCSSLSPSSCTVSGCTCGDPALVLPIYDYSQLSGGHCAVTGGYVYRGCAIPDLRGTYFFGDYCSANIWSFRFDGSTLTDFQTRTSELTPPAGQGSIDFVSSFGEDGAGELYICDLSGGEVFKIVADGVTPVLGDFDGNGLVNSDDFDNYVNCQTGPGVASDGAGCGVFDFDCDGDVDLFDFGGFQESFNS
jgi:glucose/arabinose dehydrogenase